MNEKHLDDFPKIDQYPQFNWCWAATAAGVAEFYDIINKRMDKNYKPRGLTMCKVANKVQNKDHCCQDPDQCNEIAMLEDALREVENFNEEEGVISCYLDLEAIKKEIDGDRPLGWKINFVSNLDHYGMIIGYNIDNEEIDIADPWYGKFKRHSYKIFRDEYYLNKRTKESIETDVRIETNGNWKASYLTNNHISPKT